jgi:hypothetical protein
MTQEDFVGGEFIVSKLLVEPPISLFLVRKTAAEWSCGADVEVA